MKLLHTADLHLDSPFTGDGVQGAEERRESQRRCLSRIFRVAKEQACDMILIAGDLFDRAYVTPETEALCLRLFREANCPVILATGNHDPYIEGSFYSRAAFPENVYVFGEAKLQSFDFQSLGVKVFGYGFPSAVLTESPLAGAALPEEDGRMRILCAHGELGSPISRYAPLTEETLCRMGFDYCALGHIHNPPAPVEREGRVIRYCGIPQGRSYDETGEGEVLLVTLEPNRTPVVEPIRVSEERYRWEELDLSNCADRGTAEDRIRDFLRPWSEEGVHMRLTLTGEADPVLMSELMERRESFMEGLRELELQDQTVPLVDGAYLERDVTLRGAFYRSLRPKLIHEDPAVRRLAARALQIGLAAIDNRRIMGEERDI